MTTTYMLALVPTKAEVPNNCLGCALAPPATVVDCECKFREHCGSGVFKARFMPIDSAFLLDEPPSNQELP